MRIKIIELFFGIGGFSKGLNDAGFEFDKHYFSEIDKHAIANYKYNFKDAEYIGSVTDVRGAGIEKPDIITFGSPCQDFSLAGERKGIEGQRSSLVLHAIRLIRECRPPVFIWENVKGTFSSNDGADFWAIIQAFANIGGYRCEWQLLNSSWVLPQNRERIYLVGHLTGKSEPGIFPIKEGDGAFDEVEIQERLGANIKPFFNTAMSESARRDRASGVAIRDLTPIEYERGQGFPDDWTKFGNYEGTIKEIAKGQRYKLIGNAVSKPIVQEIGKRLLKRMT